MRTWIEFGRIFICRDQLRDSKPAIVNCLSTSGWKQYPEGGSLNGRGFELTPELKAKPDMVKYLIAKHG